MIVVFDKPVEVSGRYLLLDIHDGKHDGKGGLQELVPIVECRDIGDLDDILAIAIRINVDLVPKVFQYFLMVSGMGVGTGLW